MFKASADALCSCPGSPYRETKNGKKEIRKEIIKDIIEKLEGTDPKGAKGKVDFHKAYEHKVGFAKFMTANWTSVPASPCSYNEGSAKASAERLGLVEELHMTRK